VCNSDDLRSLTDEGCRRVLLLYPPNTDLSNAVHPEELESPYREICHRLSLDRRFKFLIAGRMSYQKGEDLLGKILLRLGRENPRLAEDFSFLPAGTANLPGNLRRVASAFPGLVTSLGVLPRDVFPSVMNEIDAVLMPSRYESFGKVAAEAQSLGKPVIATDITGLREVVTDRVTGLLVGSWSADAFASAILELRRISISEPERWESMKTAARANFQQRFGKDQMDAQLRAFARSLEELAQPESSRSG
jgi:glycosyltransferase involved in cell wall biosynthesis